jgi:type III pantothenate kinase
LPFGDCEVTTEAVLPALIEKAEAVAVSNVSGKTFSELENSNKRILNLSALSRLPFLVNYKTPNTLGSDRLAAAAGAYYLFPKSDVIIVDAGTCIKFDFLSSDGVYLGGSISPGLAMRYAALPHFTGLLPLVKHRELKSQLGKSTEESILVGVQQGFIGEAEYRIAAIKKLYPKLKVVITGGDASFLEEHLKIRIFAEPNLIHTGLLNCLLNA